MSDNLIFKRKADYIEFPFQTPTYITHAVLAQHSNDNRMKVFNDYFKANYKPSDSWTKRTLVEIKKMLEDKTLQLTSN
jgi:hypothetical protein